MTSKLLKCWTHKFPMKASYLIATMIVQQSVFSIYSRTDCIPTIFLTMPQVCQSQPHPLKQHHPFCQVLHRRLTSQHNIKRPECLLTNLRSISSYRRNVLTHATWFSGGQVSVHSSSTCPGLLNVNIYIVYICYTAVQYALPICSIFQTCLECWTNMDILT